MDAEPSCRRLRLKIAEIEEALHYPGEVYLDLTSGAVVWVEPDSVDEEAWDDDNLLPLVDELDDTVNAYSTLREFVETVPDGNTRARLANAIDGRGAFRRFKDLVLNGGDVALRDSWHWFECKRRREEIDQWLRDEGIEPLWDCDIFEPPRRPDKRPELLRAVLKFVRDTSRIDGVQRIALLGSLVTGKAVPKDVDLLVQIDDGASLDQLARQTRRLLGATTATGDGCGADVFLCDPLGGYIGRVCSWRTCAPGIRNACQALHCGRRPFLNDDLQAVKLGRELIAEPPLELWPDPKPRVSLPEDVTRELVDKL